MYKSLAITCNTISATAPAAAIGAVGAAAAPGVVEADGVARAVRD